MAGHGGQADVYRKGDIAYKVYHDPSMMIPVAKIDELGVLAHDRIVRPVDVLLNKSNTVVGYTMRYVKDTYVLCELFNRDGKDRAKLDNAGVLKLVLDMQTTMGYVHSKGVVVGDANELNFLVNRDLDEVLFIDTDNYQTKNFRCMAIMPNIRDRHTEGFTPETDWFACGILWFNFLVGIHPFMCPHPDPKYKLPITPERFENRMVDCISAFHPNCKIPAACNRLDVIPQAYRDWMKAMFVDRKRLAPPSTLIPLVVVYQPKVTRLRGTHHFDITTVLEMPEEIVSFYAVHGVRATTTTAGVYLGTTLKTGIHGETLIAHTPKLTRVIAGGIRQGYVVLHNVTDDEPVSATISGEQLMAHDGRLYVKQGEQVQEVVFAEVGQKVAGATVKPVATCMLNSTKFYDGVVVQTFRDKLFINVFPHAGTSREIKVNELYGKGQIVSAKYENRVLMVVVATTGLRQYDRYVFRFSSDFAEYDVRTVPNVNFTGLNFTVLDNGVCCLMNENEEVEIFRNVRGNTEVKVIPDKDVGGDIRLFHDGTTVLFAKQDVLYSLKMK